MSAAGDPVILMWPDISTADVAGFATAAGIVTMVGASTAHAALVARQMRKPCIVGCRDIAMDIAADWRRRDLHKRPGHNRWRQRTSISRRLETVTARPERELAEVARWRAERAAAENPRLSVDSSQMPELVLV
jgi:pyruvate,orthophosphate dikinase